MTEAAFQEARIIMQKANHLRGLITKAKGNVAKWTRIEDVNRRQGSIEKANGTKKLVLRAITQLKSLRTQFEQLQFPNPNLISQAKINTCLTCNEPIPPSEKYCNEICDQADTSIKLIKPIKSNYDMLMEKLTTEGRL